MSSFAKAELLIFSRRTSVLIFFVSGGSVNLQFDQSMTSTYDGASCLISRGTENSRTALVRHNVVLVLSILLQPNCLVSCNFVQTAGKRQLP